MRGCPMKKSKLHVFWITLLKTKIVDRLTSSVCNSMVSFDVRRFLFLLDSQRWILSSSASATEVLLHFLWPNLRGELCWPRGDDVVVVVVIVVAVVAAVSNSVLKTTSVSTVPSRRISSDFRPRCRFLCLVRDFPEGELGISSLLKEQQVLLWLLPLLQLTKLDGFVV